jgi:hypothetical protein
MLGPWLVTSSPSLPQDAHRVGLRCPSAGATGGGVAAFEGAAFLLGQAAPDPGLLPGLNSPFQAGLGDLTATAYGLGSFCLEKRGASVPVWEEQLGVLAPAGSAVASSHHGRAP